MVNEGSIKKCFWWRVRWWRVSRQGQQELPAELLGAELGPGKAAAQAPGGVLTDTGHQTFQDTDFREQHLALDGLCHRQIKELSTIW